MLKNKGVFEKHIITRYGKIHYFRTLLVPNDKESAAKLAEISPGSKSVCPLDEQIHADLLPFKMTVGMMVATAKEAVRAQSYQRAADAIKEHFGVDTNANSVRIVTDFVGSIVFADDKRGAEEAVARLSGAFDRRTRHRKAGDILYIEMDGAMFNTRKREAGSSWKECKIAIAFHANDIREWTTKRGETRRSITSKRISGYIGNYQAFQNHVLALAERYDYRRCHKVVVISDGAEWIHKIVEKLFPDAVHIIDLSHVKEHVGEYGKWLHGEGEEASKWIAKTNKMLEDSQIGEILEMLKPHKDKKHPNNVTNLHEYIKERRFGMDYKAYREAGYFVGSGASESANKYVMQNRMKLQGMRWNVESGQNMLSLKARLESGKWFEVETLVKEYVESGKATNYCRKTTKSG